MPKAVLSSSTVKRLPCLPGKDQVLYWDHGHKDAVRGLGLRVTASGTRTYIVRGYPNGQERRINLEATIHKPIDEVRAEADEKRVAMNKDIDLREQEQKERDARAAASLQNEADVVTLREVMDEYVKNQTGRTGKPLREATKRDIERHVTVNLADWADKPLKALTKDRVTDVFRDLRARAPSQASQCMTVLRGLINRARERYVGDADEYLLHPVNPVTRLFGKHGLLKMQKDPARTTRIPRAKIGAVWVMLQRRRAEARTVDERASADWVCMVLLTGCRRTESGSLLWENVNLDQGWFHLPSDVVKNHNGITLPLSATLKEILAARKGSKRGPEALLTVAQMSST